MSTITIPLADEDLSFLRAYSNAQGTSLEVFLAKQARLLSERLQKPLHPDIIAASGILTPSDDAEAAHMAHLDKKYQ
jgi:hypothetical protein